MFGVEFHIGIVIGRIEYDKRVLVVFFYFDHVLGRQDVFGIQVMHPELVDHAGDRFRIGQAAHLKPVDAVCIGQFAE